MFEEFWRAIKATIKNNKINVVVVVICLFFFLKSALPVIMRLENMATSYFICSSTQFSGCRVSGSPFGVINSFKKLHFQWDPRGVRSVASTNLHLFPLLFSVITINNVNGGHIHKYNKIASSNALSTFSLIVFRTTLIQLCDI